MIESEMVKEWKAEAEKKGKIEGKLEGKRESLEKVVRQRYRGRGLKKVVEGIRACTEIGKLDEWLVLALANDALGDFRQKAGL